MKAKKITLTITEEQWEFIKKFGYSPSKLLQLKVNELIYNHINTYGL